MCGAAKEQFQSLDDDSFTPQPPNTRDVELHYSFDFAQQVKKIRFLQGYIIVL
jgi:hypothetical protein